MSKEIKMNVFDLLQSELYYKHVLVIQVFTVWLLLSLFFMTSVSFSVILFVLSDYPAMLPCVCPDCWLLICILSSWAAWLSPGHVSAQWACLRDIYLSSWPGRVSPWSCWSWPRSWPPRPPSCPAGSGPAPARGTCPRPGWALWPPGPPGASSPGPSASPAPARTPCPPPPPPWLQEAQSDLQLAFLSGWPGLSDAVSTRRLTALSEPGRAPWCPAVEGCSERSTSFSCSDIYEEKRRSFKAAH